MSRVSPLLVALFVVVFPIGTAVAQVPGGVTPGVVVQLPRPAPPRDQSAQATGTAKIRGMVVALEDGRPLRRTTVRVTAPELREPRSTTTDLSGRYEIADLPARRYTVTASRAGFVTITHGQTRPNEMGRPVELADGQTVDRINFSLPRGAAITGRVVDEYGEPVAGAAVQPMQMRFVNGRLQPSAVMGSGPMIGGMLQTPDTGEFRVWGLSPGEYLLQATLSGGPMPIQSDDRASYSPTFFPNTTVASEAQVIKLEVGQTMSGIEIVLSPIRAARITGTTLDSRGQPLRAGFVTAILQSDGPMFVVRPLGGQIKPDGAFSISGATPGRYVLRASAPPTASGVPPETLSAIVTVAEDDVTSVVLTPLQPATVVGRILLDPPTMSIQPSELRVMVSPRSPEVMRMGLPIPGPPVVHDDFTFEAKTAPGEVVVRAFATSPGTQWAVKSVTHEGRDVTEDGITLASGATVKGVDIVITNRLQSISGAVTNERGDIVTDVTVFLFPQDPDRWFPRPGALPATAAARPDQNGRYSLRMRLPPGDY